MKELKDIGVKCGNEPLGAWRYEPGFGGKSPASIVDDSPLIEKYCGLYKTYGDKRLASHLIAGLIMIIKKVI